MQDIGMQFHIRAKEGDVGKYVFLPGDPGRCEAIAKPEGLWQSASPLMRSISRPLWERKENGLPRRFAPRNDGGFRWPVLPV